MMEILPIFMTFKCGVECGMWSMSVHFGSVKDLAIERLAAFSSLLRVT